MPIIFIIILFFIGPERALSAPPGNICQLYEEGKDLFIKNKVDKAYQTLRRVERLNPGFYKEGFNYMLGYLYEKKNLDDKAISQYLREIRLNKKTTANGKKMYQLSLLGTARSCYSRARIYKTFLTTSANTGLNYYNLRLLTHKLQKKRQEKCQGLKIYAEKSDYLWYYRGLCYYLLGDYQKAMTEFENIPSGSSLYWKAMIKQGACYYKSGKYKEADRLWKRVRSSQINNPVLLSELGCAYTECNRKDKMQEAILWGAKSKDRRLAWIYLKNGNTDKAINLMNNLKFYQPELIDTWGKYANPQEKIRIKYITKFYNSSNFSYLADIYLAMAAKYYGHYLKFSRNKGEILYQTGMCYLLSGDTGRAKKVFKDVIDDRETKDVNRVMAQIYSGVCLYQEGQKESALKIWGDIVSQEKNPALRSQVGVVYAKLGIRLNKVISLCGSCEERGSPGILSWNLGLAYFSRGISLDNTEYLSRAMMSLENNHIQEAGYNPEKNEPLLLVDMANVFFNQRLFSQSAEIFLALKRSYPETTQILNAVQGTVEMWDIIKWEKNVSWQPAWKMGNL
ncbi:tetratricopeptide repeat protein [bacterium]|nr:tetratricopeptide repeat protein [bacterium]MBU1754104.1 tetratricopeptide repeat protein [bacterium]